MEQFHGTTILSVRRGNIVALGGDGQVTLGNIVVKGTARKVRKLHQGKVLAGFAGGTADAFTLLERFEAKLDKHQGNLMRSSVELAKDWRTDRMLRRLEAMLLVADRESTLIITGNGDVLEPNDGIGAIGSGGVYAQSAAKALGVQAEMVMTCWSLVMVDFLELCVLGVGGLWVWWVGGYWRGCFAAWCGLYACWCWGWPQAGSARATCAWCCSTCCRAWSRRC